MRILVVDHTSTAAMEFLNSLQVSGILDITFLDQAPQAVKIVRKLSFGLILLGDGIKKGDTYEVGLAIKSSTRNNHVPVVCIGHHQGHSVRLFNLLRPYSLQLNQQGTEKLQTYLQKEAV